VRRTPPITASYPEAAPKPPRADIPQYVPLPAAATQQYLGNPFPWPFYFQSTVNGIPLEVPPLQTAVPPLIGAPVRTMLAPSVSPLRL
jgi:hypothetical protein